MKKCFVIGLIMALIPGMCPAVYTRISDLTAEKLEKMKKLEKCQGTTKGLKIAGLSTLGLTAVGVAGNIAEAVVLNDYKDKVNKEKKELSIQQDLNRQLWNQRSAQLAANQPQTVNTSNFETIDRFAKEKVIYAEAIKKITGWDSELSDISLTGCDQPIKTSTAADNYNDSILCHGNNKDYLFRFGLIYPDSAGFVSETDCKASCKTTFGCSQLTNTQRWVCVDNQPENKIEIADYKPFTSENSAKCEEYCAEGCEYVAATKDSPVLYRCYKSKEQAAKEQKERAELDAKAAAMYAPRLAGLRNDYVNATNECINNEHCPQINMTDLAKAYRDDFAAIVAETDKVKDKVTPFDKNREASIIEDTIKLQETKYANKRPAPSAKDKLVPGFMKELEQNETNGISAADRARMDKNESCMMSQVTAEGQQRLKDLINKIANNPNHWVNTQRVINERETFSKDSMRGSCKKGQLYKECEGQAYEIKVLEAAEQEYEQTYCK